VGTVRQHDTVDNWYKTHGGMVPLTLGVREFIGWIIEWVKEKKGA
jgi:hypothetical protein